MLSFRLDLPSGWTPYDVEIRSTWPIKRGCTCVRKHAHFFDVSSEKALIRLQIQAVTRDRNQTVHLVCERAAPNFGLSTLSNKEHYSFVLWESLLKGERFLELPCSHDNYCTCGYIML